MSVIVKGMEMPKGCGLCPMENMCVVVRRRVISMDRELWTPLNYRHDDCPLVEMPASHGELVDRNDLLSEYDRQHKGPAGGARAIMLDAPAVIEAEDKT